MKLTALDLVGNSRLCLPVPAAGVLLKPCGGVTFHVAVQDEIIALPAGRVVVVGVDQVPWLTTTLTVTDWNPTAPGKISYTGPMVVAASYSPNGLGLSVWSETGPAQ